MKKFLSLILSLALTLSLATPATFAASNEPDLTPTVISDTATERVAVVDDVTATYNKAANTITITDNGESITFELAQISEENSPQARASNKTTIRTESVWYHEYKYYKTSGTYYWCVDIPSLNINPNEWCDPITVTDNGSRAAKAAEKFADLIDSAKDNEVKLMTYGGAVAISAAVGFISKNMQFTKAAYIAALAAAGITVMGDVAGIAGDYINDILNARDEYYAVQGCLA